MNGDWAFLSTLKDVKTRVCHSYDINCQWSVRVWNRLKSYPAGMQLTIGADDVSFKIPKLHMQAHRWACHPKYSFNYSLNVGRTDGECIERKWAATNDSAGAAAEMTPGGHQEYLDDVFGFQNHKKITNLGKFHGRTKGCPQRLRVVSLDNALARQMLEAIDEAVDTAREFDDFDDAIKDQRPEEHVQWEKAYDDWFSLEGWNQQGMDCPFRDINEGAYRDLANLLPFSRPDGSPLVRGCQGSAAA